MVSSNNWLSSLMIGSILAAGSGFTSIPALADHASRGGDAVRCSKSSLNSLDGLYSLDYVLTLRENDKKLVAVASIDASLDRIEKILAEKIPQAARALREFRSTLFKDDLRASRTWTDAPYGLVDLKDERMFRNLPENCRPQSLYQLVIRHKSPAYGSFSYDYDRKAIQELERTSSMQLSFLVIHEWLWDFTDDVEQIRRLDYFLHTSDLEGYSAQELQTVFEKLGFGSWMTREELEAVEALRSEQDLFNEYLRGVGEFVSLNESVASCREAKEKEALFQAKISELTRKYQEFELKVEALRQGRAGALASLKLGQRTAFLIAEYGPFQLDRCYKARNKQSDFLREMKCPR